ncbi:MAG: helix-turn-helix domain-containing protein, partial [Bacilli bacterium]|nr:helix-turn-helix domain-containing protein [Bacilli bacterium]
MNHYELGVHIHNLRISRGLTQRDIAEKLSISDKAISKWENGTSQPSVYNLQKLADIFDITLEELLKVSKENQEKKITRIVITGGLLSGKSTCCHEAKRHFEQKGYKVVIIPSMESILKSYGFADFNNYEELIKSRLEFEKIFNNLIQAMDNNKILVLYDGASLDIKSMCTKREFTSLCNTLSISPEKVRNSYDAVFHLKSIAKWDTKLFDKLNDNNNIASSLAITIDDKIIDSWIAHANYRMID